MIWLYYCHNLIHEKEGDLQISQFILHFKMNMENIGYCSTDLFTEYCPSNTPHNSYMNKLSLAQSNNHIPLK